MANWLQTLTMRLAKKGLDWSYTPQYLKASVFEPTFNNIVREAYGKNAAFFACVSALCFGAGEAELAAYGADKAPRDTPLLALMQRPNVIMGYAELMQNTLAYLATGGNAYWYKVRNARGAVIELWPYSHGVITAKPGGPTWIDGYRFYQGQTLEPKHLSADDIVHFKWPLVDPRAPYQAMAPLAAAAAEVGTDNEATRYLHTLLVNDAMPRTIIKTNMNRFLNPDEVARTKEQFRSVYGGDGRGGVMVLEGGTDVARLSLNLEELAFEAMHRIPEARICAVMRVPPIIAGVNVGLDRSTFANYGEARKSFTQDTRVPLWNTISSEIAADADLNPERLSIRHNLSGVAALQEDENAKWTRVVQGYTVGLMDEATAQGLLNLPVYVAPEPSPPPAAQAAKALGAPNTKARPQVVRGLQRIRARIASSMETALDVYFSDLAKSVEARVRKPRKSLPTVAHLLTDADTTALGDIVGGFYVDVIRASWETWNALLGVETEFGIDDPAVVAALEQSADQVTLISEATKTALRELLQYGNEQGWTLDDLVRGTDERGGIRGLIEETYKGRAKVIARTEIGNAQQRATTERYKATGIKQIVIYDGNSPTSCQTCTDLNGQIKTLEWAQTNLLEHPNCIRAFAPHFED